MNRIRVTAFVALLALPAGLTLADWGFERGDQNAGNRASGVGQISLGDGRDPGFAWSIDREPTRLTDAMLRDFNGDGEPEVVLLASGAVTALNPQTGQAWWTSPFSGLDTVIGTAEVDGNVLTTELLASSRTAAGTMHVLNAGTGGLQGEVGGLPDLSGIDGPEVVVYDLDDDGVDELVYPAALYGLASLFVSDPSSGLSNTADLDVAFTGYANFTPPRVGDFFGDGSPAIAINQGSPYTVFQVCAPTDTGATCDDGPGTLCVCPVSSYLSIHPTFAFGHHWVVDIDDDGVEELIEVPNHPLYTRSIAVLDFAEGISSGSANPDDTRQWYRRYVATGPDARLEPLREGPVDLDGDGDLELVVSFVNNDSSDTDATGTVPNDDGIDNPGGLSVGVFDGSTGDLLASVIDAVAWGTVDLDGDGTLELVTSPGTAGAWAFEEGLSGWEMDCTGGTPCALTAAWTAADRTLHPDLDALEDLGLPVPEVHTIDADGAGEPELLVYFDGELEAITADGVGGFTTVASRVLAADEELVTSDAETNSALLSGETTATVLDSTLGTLGAPIPLPSRDWSRFAAASFDGGTREAPVFAGGVFQTDTEPSAIGDADLELLPEWAMAADLDGDGDAEAVSYRNAGQGEPTFEIRVDEWNPNTSAFEQAWLFDSGTEPQLDGFRIGRSLHFATGEFDGAGAQDVLFSAAGPAGYLLVVLDGDTGALRHTFGLTERPATHAPILVEDIVDATGAAGTDGIDEVVINSQNLVEVHSVAQGLLFSTLAGFPHGVGASGDVDGDGDLEVVATVSATVNNQVEVFDDLDQSTATTLWGPQLLDLPTGVAQVLALAEVDDNAGVDLLYITAGAALLALRGDTGAEIRDRVYLSGGALSTSPTAGAAVPISILAIDVDDDGYEEAIVGTIDGWIYAVDVATDDPAAPGLAWAIEAGAAVRALAAADTDGDGYDEILVSTDNGRGSVIDGVGVALTIEEPAEGDCIPSSTFAVSGTSYGLTSVQVFFGGAASPSGDVDATSGTWESDAEARSSGTYLLEAHGKDSSGNVVLVATRTAAVGADEDEDGWYACADCDDADPARSPGTEEICEDGIDQDCDGDDAECEDPTPGDDDDSAGDDDDSAGDDDDDDDDSATPEPDGCASCDGCAAGGRTAPTSLAWMLAGALVLTRRRRP